MKVKMKAVLYKTQISYTSQMVYNRIWLFLFCGRVIIRRDYKDNESSYMLDRLEKYES